ncbi:MAG: class I SAM-dependent methyltransferase [Bacteroidota bacterium]
MRIYFFRFIHYVQHLIVSKTSFSIHSPFVWSFYNEVLRSRISVANQILIEQKREKYLADTSEVRHFDVGASSDTPTVKHLRIADIAKTSLKSKKEVKFLYRLANYYHCKNIIELGTSLGISSMYLASASTTSTVYSLDASTQIQHLARQAARQIKISNIQFIEGNFDAELPALLDSITTFDFAFVDGNHTYDATIRYFQLFKKYASNISFIVFDDIYWSKQMKQAWKEIKSDAAVTISIDLYSMGLVFFRKENTKQHFSFRI